MVTAPSEKPSPNRSTGESYTEIFATEPDGDAWYILAHQFLAATLNVQNGAEALGDVVDALAQAETLLAACSIAAEDRATAISLSELLDDFNNGRIPPGHCEKDPPGGDDGSASDGGTAGDDGSGCDDGSCDDGAGDGGDAGGSDGGAGDGGDDGTGSTTGSAGDGGDDGSVPVPG